MNPRGKKKSICLLTLPFTGTHLIKALLETSEDINWCIDTNDACEDGRLLDFHLIDSLISCDVKPFHKARKCLQSSLQDYKNKWRTTYLNKHGITVNEKKNSRYDLFFCHANHLTIPRIFDAGFDYVVTTLRHPLLVYCTTIRRTRDKYNAFDKWNKFLCIASMLWKRSDTIPAIVNPWSICADIFDKIDGLKTPQAAQKILSGDKIFGGTNARRERCVKGIKNEIRIAREKFIKTGTVSSILHSAAYDIAQYKLMEIYDDKCREVNAESKPVLVEDN